jgi:hypothetical protein
VAAQLTASQEGLSSMKLVSYFILIIGARGVKFAISKNLVVKSAVYPHENIHKFTWMSPDGTKIYSDQPYPERQEMSVLSEEWTVILITIWLLQKVGRDC